MADLQATEAFTADPTQLEAELREPKKLQAWFGRNVADRWRLDAAMMAVAVRAVLRALPAIRPSASKQPGAVLSVFRCMAAPWVNVAFREYSYSLLSQAAATAWTDNRVRDEAALLPARAARAAARMIGSRGSARVDAADDAIAFAADAGASLVERALADSARACFAAAAAPDAAFFAGGGSVAELISRRLWPRSEPDWSRAAWEGLKRALLDADEDWDVWTRWYDARREGLAASDAIEVFRVFQPADFWLQPSGRINRAIKDRERESDPASAPNPLIG
jgi:hypothetical protein